MYQRDRWTLITDLTYLLGILKALGVKSAEPIFDRKEHDFVHRHTDPQHLS